MGIGREEVGLNVLMTMDYSPWSEWENWQSSNIFETGMATPIKIGVHAQYIDLYLHDFFEPILHD